MADDSDEDFTAAEWAKWKSGRYFDFDTEDLRVGDWIGHTSEQGRFCKEDMMYSQIVGIHPEEESGFKVVVDSATIIRDDSLVFRVKKVEHGFQEIGNKMALCAKDDEGDVTFRLHAGGVSYGEAQRKKGRQVSSIVRNSGKKIQQKAHKMGMPLDLLHNVGDDADSMSSGGGDVDKNDFSDVVDDDRKSAASVFGATTEATTMQDTDNDLANVEVVQHASDSSSESSDSDGIISVHDGDKKGLDSLLLERPRKSPRNDTFHVPGSSSSVHPSRLSVTHDTVLTGAAHQDQSSFAFQPAQHAESGFARSNGYQQQQIAAHVSNYTLLPSLSRNHDVAFGTYQSSYSNRNVYSNDGSLGYDNAGSRFNDLPMPPNGSRISPTMSLPTATGQWQAQQGRNETLVRQTHQRHSTAPAATFQRLVSLPSQSDTMVGTRLVAPMAMVMNSGYDPRYQQQQQQQHQWRVDTNNQMHRRSLTSPSSLSFRQRCIVFSMVDQDNFTVVESSQYNGTCPVGEDIARLIHRAAPTTTTRLGYKTNEPPVICIPVASHDVLHSLILSNIVGVAVEPVPHADLLLAKRAQKYSTSVPPTVLQVKLWGVPGGIANKLHGFQRTTLEFIRENHGKGYIADDMGLGKTLQGLAAMCMYREEWPLLVICPAGARKHWRHEVTRWMAPGRCRIREVDGTRIDLKSVDVAICSIDSVSRYLHDGAFTLGSFCCVLVDEAHMIKNDTTKRSQAVVSICRPAKRVVLLSGTPALSVPDDLWQQLSALNVFWQDKKKFEAQYCSNDGIDEGRLAELNWKLRGSVMIRRTKAEVLSVLPLKSRNKVSVSPTDSHATKISALMAKIRDGKGQMASLVRKSGGVDSTEGTTIVETCKNAVMQCWKETGMSKVDEGVHLVRKWFECASDGDKICIFGHFRDVLDGIVNGLGLSSNEFVRIDHTVNPSSRGRLVERFQTDPSIRVAILGLSSASVALCFTAASTVLFTELTWTPATLIQAEDRCHRMGQTSPKVTCWYLVAEGTLDRYMWELVESKCRKVGEFVDGRGDGSIVVSNQYDGVAKAMRDEPIVDDPQSDLHAAMTAQQRIDDMNEWLQVCKPAIEHDDE